jgi:hypothetical protein
MTVNPHIRAAMGLTANPEIHQALERRAVEDTKILQKVNAAHRVAFREKFPGQVEHCLRLITERLQQGLRKDAEEPLSNRDCADLAMALDFLYQINREMPTEVLE